MSGAGLAAVLGRDLSAVGFIPVGMIAPGMVY
jgi:hypothetical protein